ncbi:M15 family metallopeptidase [Bacillus sp. V3B]|uniref:M15 family metallopeptidase n=1 Tax=Bacillus sp. V3B TaxID=2804915 RepID=UPI0028117EB6|nr:M15 family metallopeptidase [Bacillus sp. V3B]
MKIKRLGSIFVTLCIVLIVSILYYQYLTKAEVKKEVSMPSDLHPVVEERTNELVQNVAEKGISILITDGFRSIEDQNRLYEKGRTTGGTIVTNAKGGESLHNFGLAVDFAIKTKSGEVIWDTEYDGNGNGSSDWMEVVESAKVLGFEWGGDWKNFKDYPHLQMDFGLSLAELQGGESPMVAVDMEK